MSNQDFFDKMAPYAARASQSLGGSPSTGVILSQWANESAYGTSRLANDAKNFAGITYVPGGSISNGSNGVFANYGSIDQFVDDYVRVLKLSYYDTVRNSATVLDQIGALGASPYAESHYVSRDGIAGSSLNDIYYASDLGKYENSSPVSNVSHDMSSDDMKKYAAIGLAFVALLALTK